MRQVWHIFKKDAHYLWREIAFVDAMVVIFAWINPWWIAMLLIAAASYMIGRLIHAEPIPGDRQFWITRPYHWLSLLGAKLLFIFVFVNLPILLAQLSIVAAAGFPLWSAAPGLLWSQVLMILLGSLPVAVLGAITAGMVPYIFAILILSTVVFTMQTPIFFSAEIRHPLWPGGIEWIRDTVVVTALAAVLVLILFTQYRKRRTLLSRAAAIAGTALAMISYLYLPWPPAWALQSFSRNKRSKAPRSGSPWTPRPSDLCIRRRRHGRTSRSTCR